MLIHSLIKETSRVFPQILHLLIFLIQKWFCFASFSFSHHSLRSLLSRLDHQTCGQGTTTISTIRTLRIYGAFGSFANFGIISRRSRRNVIAEARSFTPPPSITFIESACASSLLLNGTIFLIFLLDRWVWVHKIAISVTCLWASTHFKLVYII